MAPPQKPETFMLSNEAQQSLPQDAQVALQQVDNCALLNTTLFVSSANHRAVKYFLISAPVDWTPDQYIRRFLLPTGEYVSCVLWYVEESMWEWIGINRLAGTTSFTFPAPILYDVFLSDFKRLDDR